MAQDNVASPATPSDPLAGLYVVRLYDGFDHQWIDITEPVTKEEADAVWREQTDNGTHHAEYDHIDYFRVFPANTRMLFSGGFGATDRRDDNEA